ncbi:hypothetical protein B5F28_08235 [Gemmiger sp. An194]|nr:hypothetical protein B5F28_08235 [Gemmiger sp. An194]
MSLSGLLKFEAVIDSGGHTSSVADLINLTQNLDCFEFYPDIENEEDLGRYFTQDLPIPEELKDYFDYEAYGRDCHQHRADRHCPVLYPSNTGPAFPDDSDHVSGAGRAAHPACAGYRNHRNPGACRHLQQDGGCPTGLHPAAGEHPGKTAAL